jgi:hypothetical protein
MVSAFFIVDRDNTLLHAMESQSTVDGSVSTFALRLFDLLCLTYIWQFDILPL